MKPLRCPLRHSGFTLKMSLFTSPLLENGAAANLWGEKEAHKLSRATKSQISGSSPSTQRASLFPEYSLSGESLVCVSVEGQVRPFIIIFFSTSGMIWKARGVCMKAACFLSCVCVGLGRGYSFQMEGGLKCGPLFIQGNSLWIAHSVSLQKDLIHWCRGPSGCPRLK